MDMTEHRDAVDGRRSRWVGHNQTRRREIIDAALAVLERHRPGDEVQLQLIADEAGLSRTVVYRHFADRADLDRAVQRRICGLIGERLQPALRAEGTPEDVVRHVVEAFVRWAVAHPTLLWFVERDLSGWGPSPLAESFEVIAEQIATIVRSVVAYLGAELSADDRAALDPWVFGMIGAVMASVRRWLARPVLTPSVEATVAILSESVWLQIGGMAASRGLQVDELPVAELVRAMTEIAEP